MTTKDNTQDVQGVVETLRALTVSPRYPAGASGRPAQTVLRISTVEEVISLLLSEHEGRVRAEAENEQLRLAICGGEDAPGYAASVPLSQIIEIAQTQGRERAELAEAATAIAQARVEELERALEHVRQSLKEQAEARVDPDMPILTAEVREALREDAEAIYALHESQADRVKAHGLSLLIDWQDRAAKALNPTGAAG